MANFYGNPQEYVKLRLKPDEEKALIDDAMRKNAEMMKRADKKDKQ